MAPRYPDGTPRALSIEETKALMGLPSESPKQPPDDVPEAEPYPEPLSPAALHGVAGDFVRMVEPHSEADPVALLVQLLTGFGNIIGKGPHFRVEGSMHSAKLFTCLVGETSKGRKGTSWDNVARVLKDVDETWYDARVRSGLSSGEGLIWQVRDPLVRRDPVKEKGRVVDYVEIEADPGESDKRLLVIESELGGTLRVLKRDSNTLSAVVRDAWDKDRLRTMTKNSPAVSTGCHISVIGHVTAQELRRHLTETDVANGFANRFLWLCTRRSKCLPEGGELWRENLGPIVRRIQAAADAASGRGELRRDAEARALWAEVYPELSHGLPGMLGAVTSRSEAQTMRLALIYALLDEADAIGADHLRAGLAVWQYAEESARYIFGSAVGDPLADEIHRLLGEKADGLTRTELRDRFGRHKSAAEISRALETLHGLGLARPHQRETDGRWAEVWRAA